MAKLASTRVYGNLIVDNALNIAGQLTSTVATGTAPFAVSSTTRVANLNVAAAGVADAVGSVTVGSTTLPIYLNAGAPTALTQANLRIGVFGTAAIGSTTLPVYVAANGVTTALTQSNLQIGIFGTTAIGSTTLPVYIAANGIATALTQANLRIGIFGTSAIGSASQPVYLAANGVPTAGNTIPTNTNQLTNGAGFISGIDSSMVTTALGFTPYSNTNPSGYTSAGATGDAHAGVITGAVHGATTAGNNLFRLPNTTVDNKFLRQNYSDNSISALNAADFRTAIGAGTVTSVTGTTNHISVATGTTTPVISLATAFGDTINPYASKTANYILAAPSGSAGVPSFRALTALDLGTTLTPTFGTITTGTAGQTWVIDGSTTSLLFQSGATPTTRLTLTNAGALTVTGAIVASNFSGSSSGTNTGDQTNISGTASNVTGIVAVANGGTGNTSVDTTPTASSTKMVTSGGVYTAFQSYTPTSRTINGLALSNNITLGGAEISPVATFSATGGETTTNLSDSHANKFWTVGSNGVNRTLYLSKAVSDTLAIGTEIHLMHNASTYTITISVEGTLTLQSLGSKVKLAGTYAVVTLKKIATTTWLLFGALA